MGKRECQYETLRGHPIYEKDGKFYYVDNDEPTVDNWRKRNCGHCNKPNRQNDHDACLGELQGVINACCGHGDSKQAYIQFNNSELLFGKEAIEYFKSQSRLGDLNLEQKTLKMTKNNKNLT